MKAKSKLKKGMPVIIVDKKYRHCKSYGIVTEVFDSMVQTYGVDWHDELGYHEYETDEITCTPCEKERVKFEVDQAVKDIERKKLSTELKFNQLKQDHEEAVTDMQKVFA